MNFEKIKNLDRNTKFILLGTVLCIIVTAVMFLNGFKYATQKKIQVVATITNLEYYDNSTEDTVDIGYRVYGDYQCLGKKYTNIFCKDVSSDTDLKEGSKIDIEVYADNPEEVATNTTFNGWIFLGFSVIMIFVSVKKIKDEKQS